MASPDAIERRAKAFVHLAAAMDWPCRYELSWEVSAMMDEGLLP